VFMAYSIIQKSQLEGAKRLDAEYYQPEYLGLENTFSQSRTEKIIDLTDFVKKGIFDLSPDNYTESGVPFVRVQNIKNGFLDEENLVSIPDQVHNKEKKTELRPLDIILSKVGTVGEISVVPSRYSKANFSQNVIGLKVKAERIPKGFLALFLLSKLGQLQIARANMLQVQAKLELKDIRDLLIVRLSKEEEIYFHEELLKIEKLFEESKSLYSKAEKMLLDEVGVKKDVSDYPAYSVVNFSEVKKAGRMDAEYFQNRFGELIAVTDYPVKPLGEFVDIKKGFEPGSEAYEESGKLFIRVSSLSKEGITDKDQKYLNEKLFSELKANFQPKKGEILLTKDATPGIAYVLKEPIEGIISGGVVRLKVKEGMDPEYLALCINSIFGQLQVDRYAGGSIIKHWKLEQIKKIFIPIVPLKIQQKIAEMVRESHTARAKAKQLLEIAKRGVEMAIEKDKKEAEQ